MFAAEQVEKMYQELNNIDNKFFESALLPAPEVKVENESKIVTEEEKYKDHMPFFKQTRLRIQGFLNARDKKMQEKRLEKNAKKQAPDWLSGESELQDLEADLFEMEEGFGVDSDENEVKISNSKKVKKEKKSDKEQLKNADVELVGGVKEQATENEMVLDCDDVVYNDSNGDIEAVGNPVLIFPPQKIKMTADKMTYNKDSNILKAIGNVVLTKDGMPVYGDYIQVNMNEENIFMDNITTATTTMKICAKKATSDNNKLILNDGRMYSDNSFKYRFVSRMIGPDFSRMIISEEDQNLLMSGGDTRWRLSASEIYVDSKKEHDTVQIKDAELYHNDKYLFTFPSFTAHTNKNQEFVEANYPELGSMSRFGMFAGPGFVFDAPFGSVVKLVPLVNYKDDFGIGGAIKYNSAFNRTQFMYGSGADIFVLRGRQELDDNLFFQYGSNAYMDDWFLGRRMPKYLAELVYDKGTTVKDFLVEGKDLRFRHRASAAYAHDGEYNMHTESIKSTNIGTMRLRYMAEVDQSLYKYLDEENRRSLELSMVMQGSAAVYGTGDTQFVGRIGPRIHTQYKYWMQDIGYFLTGYSDHTPMPVYDMYRYGHSNIYIREALRVNKYLTVGWWGSVTLTNDSPNGEMFQENAFIVSLGPDDFKVNLGYDFMRQTTYFTVAVLVDTKGTTVEFDKMEIKNPERLGHSDKKKDDNSVAFKSGTPKVSASKKLQYAEVIDIEDPNKESI